MSARGGSAGLQIWREIAAVPSPKKGKREKEKKARLCTDLLQLEGVNLVCVMTN